MNFFGTGAFCIATHLHYHHTDLPKYWKDLQPPPYPFSQPQDITYFMDRAPWWIWFRTAWELFVYSNSHLRKRLVIRRYFFSSISIWVPNPPIIVWIDVFICFIFCVLNFISFISPSFEHRFRPYWAGDAEGAAFMVFCAILYSFTSWAI